MGTLGCFWVSRKIFLEKFKTFDSKWLSISEILCLGYAIIQLPELLVGFYKQLTNYSNKNTKKQIAIGTKAFETMNKKSYIQTQLTMSSNHESKSAQHLCYGHKEEAVENKYDILKFMTKNLEIQNKRFEKLEYQMSLLLKNIHQQHPYEI